MTMLRKAQRGMVTIQETRILFEHLKIEGFEATAEAYAEDGADEGMGGGDWEAEFGGEKDCGGGAEFGAKAAVRCEFCDLFADGFNHAPAPSSKANYDAKAADSKKPRWDARLCGKGFSLECVHDGCDRTNSICNIVCAVSKSNKACAENLERDEDFFYALILACGIKAGIFLYSVSEALQMAENIGDVRRISCV